MRTAKNSAACCIRRDVFDHWPSLDLRFILFLETIPGSRAIRCVKIDHGSSLVCCDRRVCRVVSTEGMIRTHREAVDTTVVVCVCVWGGGGSLGHCDHQKIDTLVDLSGLAKL